MHERKLYAHAVEGAVVQLLTLRIQSGAVAAIHHLLTAHLQLLLQVHKDLAQVLLQHYICHWA
jgi:hypothetical protein